MLSYEVDPDLVRPLAPAGTEIDFFQGRTYLSLVGFMFLDIAVETVDTGLAQRSQETRRGEHDQPVEAVFPDLARQPGRDLAREPAVLLGPIVILVAPGCALSPRSQ